MSRILTAFLTLCIALTVAAPISHAHYARPDLVDIPIARLISNLESRVKKEPKNSELLHHLARTHAMAYAKRMADTDTVKQNTRYNKDGIWFGYEPPHVPYRQRQEQAPADVNAKAHLATAIKLYDQVLALNPKRATVIRLGRAWCAKEAGKTEEAKKDFRQVIKEAWVTEGKGRGSAMGNYVTAEAMSYLKPMLDAKKDAAELADFKRRTKILSSFPRAVTPIAVPLKTGLAVSDIIDSGATVNFDLDGSGRNLRWQWLKPGTAAWLVHDPRMTGTITSGLQLFGNRSFNLMPEDGYTAMRLLDNNDDGQLMGIELHGLSLWHDRNADGVSNQSEVRPLREYGVVFLNCRANIGSDGVLTSAEGIGFDDGSTRPTWDVVLDQQNRPER